MDREVPPTLDARFDALDKVVEVKRKEKVDGRKKRE
jgi:hypothetical protein